MALVVMTMGIVGAKHPALYEARKGKCDFFVSPEGSDDNDGTSLDEPLESLSCLLDSAACPDSNVHASPGDVICLMAGRFLIDATIYSRMAVDARVTVRALGPDHSAILDGQDKVSLINALQTNMVFNGISFVNGKGTSGAAVYGERDLSFENCYFGNNSASVHAGAVMSTRFTTFTNCIFENNSARFAGAVRVSDIGSAVFNKCKFIGNKAINRGGAIITQIEKPEEQSVKITDTLFCFNEAEISPNIYNFRSTTHECKGCRFDAPRCCSDHGRVVTLAAAAEASTAVASDPATAGAEGAGAEGARVRVCKCEAGWAGPRCEVAAPADGAVPVVSSSATEEKQKQPAPAHEEL